MLRIVVLISGRGSNLAAILDGLAEGGVPAQVVGVISNRRDAAGLGLAARHGIASVVVPHGDYPSREAFDAALARAVDAYDPGLVILAGFMRVLTPAFVERYAGRLMNIHPSLLPAFPGLNTHERALAAGCKIHGATVHFVTADLDHGPIIVQAAVPVLPDDDAPALAARVLAQEHVIYMRAVAWFARGHIVVDGRGVVRVTDAACSQLVMA